MHHIFLDMARGPSVVSVNVHGAGIDKAKEVGQFGSGTYWASGHYYGANEVPAQGSFRVNRIEKLDLIFRGRTQCARIDLLDGTPPS